MFLQVLAWARLPRRRHRRSLVAGDCESAAPAQPLDLARLEDRILYSVTPVGGAPNDAAAPEVIASTFDAAASQWQSALDVSLADASTSPTAISVETALPLDVGAEADGDAPVDAPIADAQSLVTEGSEFLLLSDESYDLLALSNKTALESQTESHPNDRLELVFIDPDIENYEQLLNDVLNASAEGRRLEVVMLDAARDGMTQIGQALAEHEGVDAVHLLAHGADGAIKLGDISLHSGNLQAYAGDLNAWSGALASDAKLLLYGCNFVGSIEGQALLDTIGILTGADVVAIDDFATPVGGEVNLEQDRGGAEVALSPSINGESHRPELSAANRASLDGPLEVDKTIDNLAIVLTSGASVSLSNDVDTGHEVLASTFSTVVFDVTSGQLTIYGDAGDNVVREWLTADGFLEVSIDGVTHSARPDSAWYDPLLGGATWSTLSEVVMLGRGGNDLLVIADQTLDDGLIIDSDGALLVEGSVHVGQGFHASATAIDVTGSVTAHGGYVSIHSASETLVRGSIDVSAAPGGVGGRIEVLGPVVALLDSAVINASGDAGGGTVLIGGDFQGHNPEIPNSQYALVTAGCRIHADALVEGDGGTVVVWSDLNTHFYGHATARGGSTAGDGGLVEVSGKENLTFRGSADLTAANGLMGTLLLDPLDITIANGSGDGAADGTTTFSGNPSGGIGQILSADTGPTTIYETELEGLSNSTNIILQATRNITISNLGDNVLNLTATTGSLTILADADSNGVGSFSMTTSDTIRTQGGAVTISGASVTAGSINTTGGTNLAGGNVTITATGTATVSGTITTSGGTYLANNPGRNAGSVSITGSTVSVETINALGRTATTAGFAGGDGGAVVLDATSGAITLGGSISTTGGNGSGAGAGGNAGNITINDAITLTGNRTLSAVGGTGGTTGAGGNIQLLGTVDGNTAGTRTLTLTAGTGDVTVGGAMGATNSLAALTITGNDISLNNIGGGAAGVAGATSVTVADNGGDTGSIQLSGVLRTTGAQTYGGTGVTSVAGDLITTNTDITFNNAVSVTGLSSLAAGTATAVFNSTLDIGTNTLVVSADEITLGGNVSGVGGNLTLRPGTTGAAMQLGSATIAANQLDLTPAKLALIQSGFASVAFGRSDSLAPVTVNSVSFTDSTTISAGSSTLTVAGAITSTSDLRLVSGIGGIAINASINVGASNLTLASGGSVSQTASLSASGLALSGTATFTLSLSTNDVDTLSADINGSLDFRDADNLTVGTVGTTVGITTGNPSSGGSVTITASGYLTVNDVVDTSTGTGGVLTVSNVALNASPVLGAGSITLVGLNQPPVLDLDANNSSGQAGANFATSFSEGAPVLIADVDAVLSDADDANLVSLTVTITNLLDGTSEVLAADTSGTSIIASYDSVTGVLTLSGADTAAHYQQVLRTITYNNTSQTPNTTARTVTFVASDGTDSSNVGTTTVAVNAVNDAPTNTVPGPQSTNEDTALVFSSGNGNPISIADLDAGGSAVEVTLTAANGAITLSQTTGLSFTAGDGTADAVMTFTGSVANINAALNGLSFAPTANYNGAASLQIVTNDQGNTGSSGALSDSDTVNITVNAVNDAPVNSIPAPQSTTEDTALVFSSGNGNAISIADLDAGAGSVQVTLTATNGAITLSQTTGLSFTAGDGTADAVMTFTGSVANINAALNGLVFAPAANYNGAASLQIATNDQGNSGSGGALSDTDTVNITVNAVNDAPLNTVPGPQSTTEDTALIFSSGNGNPISIADLDAGGSVVEVTLTATNGAITLSQTTGLSFTAGDGTADAVMTFTGTVANINAALNGLSFAPTANYNGAASLQIVTNDQGNTGSGGALSDTDTVNISVNAVNDAPLNSVPAPQSTNEDTSLVFSSAGGNAITIGDVDAGGSAVEVTLTASNGAITLSQTTGLSFTAGDGTADAVMTFTGSVTNINAALNGLFFAPTAQYNGAASLQITTNDQGNSGSGGALSDTDTVNITVNAVNDAPVNSIPAPQSTTEDTSLVFSSAGGNAITIGDLDAGGSAVEVTLTATNGAITLSGTAGLTFSSGDGTADAVMTFMGTAANINAALNGLSFAPTANYNGAASLQIVTNDQGNSGSGGALSDTDTVNITVNAVNDAPLNTVPGPQSTTEDTSLVFNAGNGNLISIADLDAGGSPVEVTLTATNGVITLSQTTGLSFTAGDGTADAVMTFTGTAADINAALNGLVFAPAANYNGAASLQITTNDQGNSGSGGALSDTDTVNITVNAVNDAPVNSIPGPQSTNEDTSVVFSSGNGNAISIADLDAGANPVEVTLTASNGAITLSQTTGLLFTAGDGTSDAVMTFTGSVANINAALNGLVFAPAANFNGAASLQIVTNDQGNSGSGGALSDSDTVNITVNAVNDAPVNSIPAPQSTNEDTSLVFSSGNGNAISIADLDAGSSPVEVTLTATNGAITLSQTTGLSFTAGDGTADAVMTFTGSVANINAALNGLSFAPTTNYNGAASLQIVTNDQGNSGSGGALSDTDTVNITVNAVNDAPVNSIPAPQSTTEDTSLVFSSAGGNAITIGDLDAGGSAVEVTLTAANGAITLSQTMGLSFTAGDGTADAVMTFTGTVANINAALNGLSFAPTANFNGAASLQIATNDQGNSGSGGALSDTDNVAITVNAVNDAPVNTVPGPQSTTEDTALIFSSGNGNPISIADLDAGGSVVEVTLTASNGTITLAGAASLTFTSGDGASDAVMTFTGALADINAALNGLSFAPTANYNGAASLQLTTNDQGNSGSGGALSDSDTVNITVNAVNDAPVNSIPAPQSTNEDTALVFSSGNGNAINIADQDAGAGPIEVTLTATNGAITLSQTTGLSFSTGDGTGDAVMTFTGTVADINAALNGLSFGPTANFNGAASLQIAANDQGNSGSGGALSDTDTVNITVNAVNDAPINTVPGPQSTNEDTALVFSSGNGNAITIADLDAGAGPIEVSLTATNGAITLSQTTGLSFSSGDGASDAVMTFTGTVADINAALNGLSFAPTANYNGAASLQIITDDLGNTGSGGAQSDTDTVAITVNAVNDAPINTVPGPQSTNEDTALVFSSGNGNLITVGDLDAGDSAVEVTLTAANGTITLSQTTGISFTSGDGASDAVMTFTGTVADINAALNGLSFAPTANFNGAASLQLTTNDQGNSGSGGALSDSDTVNITVNAVNDAPVNTVPGPQSTDEETSLVFSAGNGNAIGIADLDAGAGPVEVTLTASNGTITLAGVSGLTFTSGDGASDAAMTFTGTITDINAALDGLSFSPMLNYYGAASLQIVTNDQGTSGSGGPLSDTDTVNITVNEVSDPPLLDLDYDNSSGDLGANFRASFSEDGGAVGIADADAMLSDIDDTDLVSLTVLINNLLDGASEILAANTVGTSITASYSSATGVLSLTGIDTVVNYEQVLRTVTYNNTSQNPNTTTRTIEFTAYDGVATSNLATTTVSITRQNDAPVANADAYSVNEDERLIVAAPGLLANDVDFDGDALAATLVSGPANGTLSLGLDGSFTYTPRANFNGSDIFTYRTSDGTTTSTATATITVNAVNDAPLGVADHYVVDNNAVLTVPVQGVLVNDSDIDGDTMRAVVLSGPEHGVLVLNADGSFTYTPDIGWGGNVTFSYQANDNTSSSNVVTVTISINAVVGPRVHTADDVGTVNAESTRDDGAGEQANDNNGHDLLLVNDKENAETGKSGRSLGDGWLHKRSYNYEKTAMRDATTKNFERDTVSILAASEPYGLTTRNQPRELTPVPVMQRSLADLSSELRAEGGVVEYGASQLMDDIDAIEEDLERSGLWKKLAYGTATALAGCLSLGYLLWTRRGQKDGTVL
ncbi:MAG: tandem-95 repeat protein [Pirellulales bacterium]